MQKIFDLRSISLCILLVLIIIYFILFNCSAINVVAKGFVDLSSSSVLL